MCLSKKDANDTGYGLIVNIDAKAVGQEEE